MVSLRAALSTSGPEIALNQSEIKATYKEISKISKLPPQFACLKKLHLSHNKLSSLEGIEQFHSLESLSLAFNKIPSLQELTRIPRPPKLTHLNIYGNPLTRHPNHLRTLITLFPDLKKIDDLDIQPSAHTQYKDLNERLSKRLIPFLIF
jgi:hypothetical protein